MEFRKFFTVEAAGAIGGAVLGIAIVGYNLSLIKSFLLTAGIFLIWVVIGRLLKK